MAAHCDRTGQTATLRPLPPCRCAVVGKSDHTHDSSNGHGMSHELQPADATGHRTNASKFMADRGVIQVRRFKSIGTLKCQYGTQIRAESLVLMTTKSSAAIQSTTFAIRLEQANDENGTETALLDFDEAEEFSSAIGYIASTAGDARSSGISGEYLEAHFSTKDSIRVGFYRSEGGEVKAFVSLGPHADSAFVSPNGLLSFKKLIDATRQDLIGKGATVIRPDESLELES